MVSPGITARFSKVISERFFWKSLASDFHDRATAGPDSPSVLTLKASSAGSMASTI
jgi:hypothetical protein